MTGRARSTADKARELVEGIKEESAKTDKDKPKPKPKPKASPKPPTRVEPGWLHHAISEAILKKLRVQTEEVLGTPLEVGELSETEDLVDMATAGDDSAAEDGREPEELLARVIAHLMHRTPGVRKIEKRLEGKDLRSGIASDIGALIAQLVRRNKHLGPKIAARLQEQYRVAQAKAKEAKAQEERGKATVPVRPMPMRGGGEDERLG